MLVTVNSPTVAVIVAAAGSSSRMGAGIDKQFVLVGGRPLLWHSLQFFNSLPGMNKIIVTVSESNEERVAELLRETVLQVPWMIVRGGAERQHSVRNAVLLTDESSEIVMVHDGARPFLETGFVMSSVAAAAECGASAVAVPVKDTIKTADEEALVISTIDRSKLWQIQTPQTFRRDVLLKAHTLAAEAGVLATDDAALVEWSGGKVRLVKGSYLNFKVTTPEDVMLAEAVAAGERGMIMQRVGIGYDVHRLVAGRPLMLGGVHVPHDLGLEGHSDADVLLHAISDALLGAAGLGDIGRHFPDTDPSYKGISSLILLRQVREKIAESGFSVLNIDAVIEAQAPKLAPYISLMNGRIAETLDMQASQVNVKATTTEGLGFVGRKEGIAAKAVVMIGL